MSLLIIRCPLKPFLGQGVDALGDGQDVARKEEFRWHLSDEAGHAGQSGMGNIESMPYADRALVLMPTLDVRLIDMKVPLVNSKKLHAVLPGLVEEHLLMVAERVQSQVLPPLPGVPALQRTVAAIDRAWFAWLMTQLSGLLAPQVRLIPDCFLLTPIVASEVQLEGAPNIGYEINGENLVWTVRTGEQMGSAWVEQMTDPDQSVAELQLHLPSKLREHALAQWDWDWMVLSAYRFVQNARYSGLNLIPHSFRRQVNANKGAEGKRTSRMQVVGAWIDERVWRRSQKWLIFCVASGFIGFALHLAWLVVADWRWNQQMQSLAIPNLSPGSVAVLAGDPKNQNVIGVFAKQVTQAQRRQGLAGDADFAQMAGKLQQLKSVFGNDALQTVDYDGYALSFQFKPGALDSKKWGSTQLMARAHSLGMGIVSLGGDRYRLLPYAGLGED